MTGNQSDGRTVWSFSAEGDSHWKGKIEQGSRQIIRDYFVIEDRVEIVERFKDENSLVAVLTYAMEIDPELDFKETTELLGSDHCDDVKYQIEQAFEKDVSVFREQCESSQLRKLVKEGDTVVELKGDIGERPYLKGQEESG